MTTLIGGPFDGAVAVLGDPGAEAIWPMADERGKIWFCCHEVLGRPRYNRQDGSAYIYSSIKGMDATIAAVMHMLAIGVLG